MTCFSSSLHLPTEPSGIFVKNIIPGSAADHNGQIHVHDKIVAVSRSLLIYCCRTNTSLHIPELKEQCSKDFLKLIKPSPLCRGNNSVVCICLGRFVTEMSFGLLWLKYFIFRELVNSS